MAEAIPPRKRKRRRIWKVLALASLTFAGVVAALPWLLSTPPARGPLVGMVNEALSPSRVEVGSIALSWTGPIRVSGLALHDHAGKRTVAVPEATLDRGLLALLLDRKHLGTLTLDGVAIDVERRGDGSIDLLDAFAGHHRPRPKPATGGPSGRPRELPEITVKVVRGSLRARSPEMPDPVAVDRFDLDFRVPAAPGAVTMSLKLEQGEGAGAAALAIEGRHDLHSAAGDLSLTVTGHRWPWSAGASGVVARGRLDGRLVATRGAGRWGLSGDARLLDLDAGGPALAGDRLHLDRVAAAWEVGQTSRAWTVRRLELTSPVATVGAEGALTEQPGASARIEGRVDLAALARQLPHALRLRDGLSLERGEARARAVLKTEADGQRYEVEAALSDLVAREQGRTITLRSPAALSALLSRRSEALRVDRLSAKADFLDLTGSGDLDRGVTVQGTLDLAALQAQLRDLVDFGGLVMTGRGRFAADYRRVVGRYSARAAVEIRKLDVRGLTADPILRDLARVDAVLHGPAVAPGLPCGWDEASLHVKADPSAATLTASTRNGPLTLTATASSPFPLGGPDALASAKAEGRWADGALDLDDLHIALRPQAPSPSAGSLDLAMKGRYDRAMGVLTLAPKPTTGPSPIVLSPQGLKVSGLGKTGAGPKVEGSAFGDLDALDRLLVLATGGAPIGLGGTWNGSLATRPDPDGRLRIEINLGSPDLSLADSTGRGRRPEGPFGAAFSGWYRPDADRLDVENLTVGTRYAVVFGAGRLDEPGGRRVADLQGHLSPNWATLKTLVASAVEPGATVQGAPARGFRVRGPLSGGGTAELLRGLDAEVGVDLAEFRAFGMTLGATPLVARCAGGRLVIDPIQTTLNNGRVDLRPEVRLDDPKGLSLVLAPGSSIAGAEINDEVSRRVLAFVAPVLQDATSARGRISAEFRQAEFPIGGDAGRTSTVVGRVVFEGVEFGGGPMAADLLGLVGHRHGTTVKLQQPVELAIADGRINQSGLVIPVGRAAPIVIRGSVGFDQTLALRADVPVTPAMLGMKAGPGAAFGDGTTVPIPIGGTLSRPTIDQRALRVALGKAGETLLKNGAADKAVDLLKRLSREAKPNRPGPARP
jgi:translocation and assembly module TamB